jgi:hypothetical protein
MDKMIGTETCSQAEQDLDKPLATSRETMRTLGAMVAILGATLGVNVNQALAAAPGAQPDDKASAEFLKLKAAQYKQDAGQLKIDAQQQKGVPAVQLKLDAKQDKGVVANQLKLDSKQLKIDGTSAK